MAVSVPEEQSAAVPEFSGRLARWSDKVWKVMLLFAAVCMPVAGVLMAAGQKPTSDLIATAGFTIGVLAVPFGLLSLRRSRARSGRRNRALSLRRNRSPESQSVDPQSPDALELESTP